MKLYGVHLSPFVNKVRLQCAVKGLDGRVEFCLPPGGDLKSDEYLALTPLGKIPALEVAPGGLVIGESSTICEYLEDKYPEPSLRGGSPEESARIRLLERLVDVYLYPQLVVLFAQLEERNAKKTGAAVAGLQEALGYVEHWMPENAEFAASDHLTLADCGLIPPLFFVAALGKAWGLDGFGGATKITQYWARVGGQAEVSAILTDMQQALVERQAQV